MVFPCAIYTMQLGDFNISPLVTFYHESIHLCSDNHIERRRSRVVRAA